METTSEVNTFLGGWTLIEPLRFPGCKKIETTTNSALYLLGRATELPALLAAVKLKG